MCSKFWVKVEDRKFVLCVYEIELCDDIEIVLRIYEIKLAWKVCDESNFGVWVVWWITLWGKEWIGCWILHIRGDAADAC